MNDNCDYIFAKSIIKRLEEIGCAKQKLNEILEHDLVSGHGKYDISKHNEFWRSPHDEEDEKLEDIRCLILGLQDIIWELYKILDGDE